MNRNTALNQKASGSVLEVGGCACSFGQFAGAAGFGTSYQTGYCWQQTTH